MLHMRNIVFAAAVIAVSSGAASARDVQLESNLNLRDGPSLQRRVMVVMPAGATISVGECRGEWCKVRFRGHQGYASAPLLTGDGAYAAAQPAVQEAPVRATKYDADDAARVLQWNDREWRDRYLREMELRRDR